uniref:BLTX540 n=1 Tax=Nephila pilipes TaxID=299642 RepID=A0A076KV26_NEPPI|nr:BLTX540 [Nephila pilipes]
MDKVSELIF